MSESELGEPGLSAGKAHDQQEEEAMGHGDNLYSLGRRIRA